MSDDDLIRRAYVASAIQSHVNDDRDRYELSRAIAALPAAAPAGHWKDACRQSNGPDICDEPCSKCLAALPAVTAPQGVDALVAENTRIRDQLRLIELLGYREGDQIGWLVAHMRGVANDALEGRTSDHMWRLFPKHRPAAQAAAQPAPDASDDIGILQATADRQSAEIARLTRIIQGQPVAQPAPSEWNAAMDAAADLANTTFSGSGTEAAGIIRMSILALKRGGA